MIHKLRQPRNRSISHVLGPCIETIFRYSLGHKELQHRCVQKLATAPKLRHTKRTMEPTLYEGHLLHRLHRSTYRARKGLAQHRALLKQEQMSRTCQARIDPQVVVEQTRPHGSSACEPRIGITAYSGLPGTRQA